MARRDPISAHATVPPRAPLPLAVLLVAFVLSGASGLIYESVWTRYLGLFVGHGAYAQIIVLAIFMGGMAIGALGNARTSERIADPLRLYAMVEVGIGIAGLLFHPAFVALTGHAYRVWFPSIGETWALHVIKWTLAALLILPASVLLGSTFPLMTAGVLRRRPREPGRVVALLYFANSLGAAAGVLAAGFWLVGVVGLTGTLATAASLNLAVAIGIGWLTRRGSLPPVTAEVVERAPASPSYIAAPGAPARAVALQEPSFGWLPRLLLAISFGTAVASFVYEIAWIRMLSLVLGSATHSFELMLSAFILGLALGALWVHRRADGFARPLATLGAAQWAMGVLALATLPLYAWSFHWMAPMVLWLPAVPHGYETFSIARYGICLAIMLPATFCAGITLPLLTRILIRSGGEGAIGAVYGANTLGSILGASLAGLVLLPWLGVERLLAAGAALDIALGILLLAAPATQRVTRRVTALAALAGVLLVILAVTVVKLDPLHLVSGVYRTGHLISPAQSRVVYYHDGRTASVSVRVQPDGSQTLSTNGKPDASMSAAWLYPDSTRPRQPFTDDESTQIVLGILSLVHAPEATRAAVIGIGSGMTSHVLLGDSRVTRVVTIEIEPDMITAARLFRSANHRVFDDPRSQLVVDDARSYFAASQEHFDLVVSEPSNPWVSGVSGLFTDEFYRRVKTALTEKGRIAQWIHLYSLDDDLLLSVLAAIHRNFADFKIFLVSSTDVLIVAGDRLEGEDRRVIEEPGIAADLAPGLPLSWMQLEATFVTDRATMATLLDRIPPNSDFLPILDLGAERARFQNRLATGLLRLQEDGLSLAAIRAPRVPGPNPPPSIGTIALGRVPRLNAWLENMHLRASLAGHPAVVDTAEASRLFVAAQRLDRVLNPRGKTDPHEWIENVIQSEEDLHRGTVGWVDEAFFARVLHMAQVGRAPRATTHVIEWLRALEAHDYARAAPLTDSVIAASANSSRPWVTPALVLDGGTTAKLATGDVEGAARVYGACGMGDDPGDDLRTRLIHAWITAPR